MTAGRLSDEACSGLYYRRLSIRKAFPTRHIANEHQAILSAVLSGEADKAADLLSAHFAATAEVLLKDGSVFPDAHAEQDADIDDAGA